MGVLTFHRCVNYGSFFQAQAMLRGIGAQGCDAVLLDHHDRAVELREWRCALQPMLPERSPVADRRAFARKTRAFAEAAAQLPKSAPFSLSEGPAGEAFDAIVVGSDEVWNPSHPWYGDAGLFWGEGLQAPRLIAHAASCGGHAEPWAEGRAAALRRFAAIAVRDRTTRAQVEAVTGQEPPLVLDPCLQFPPQGAVPLARAPYALVYGHEFPGWAGAAVRAWAGLRGLTLVSIGYRNAFADEQWLDAGPEAFAAAVAGASAVITTMFHGCVFALNAAVPFVAIPSPYRSTKVRDLLHLLGAMDHLAGNAAAVGPALTAPPSAAVANRIAELRAHSHAVLAHALA